VAENLGPYLHELVQAADKALDEARQAEQHYANGDAQAACDMVNVMHYKTGQLEDLRLALVKDFQEQGFTPGQTSSS
jgi:hypothetical protein